MTAGVVYWILNIVNSGANSTFTVSATPLNANPNSTAVALSTASGTVSTTVNPTDMYFNNPNGPQWPTTNSNTYSVVGGNTALYGSQVLANVAIGVAGAGTIWAESTGTKVAGIGTDFANSGATNTVVQYVASNGTPITLGYVSSNAQPNIQLSAATATGNFLN